MFLRLQPSQDSGSLGWDSDPGVSKRSPVILMQSWAETHPQPPTLHTHLRPGHVTFPRDLLSFSCPISRMEVQRLLHRFPLRDLPPPGFHGP